MSLPSALLGFIIFKSTSYGSTFTDVENVFVQSIAVAVGTGPLCYGFIGIIPAIEKFLHLEESGGFKVQFNLVQLMIWSLGLGLFGVFFAIPLRQQVIVKEKLPFPSGSATATLISVLHKSEIYQDESDEEEDLELSQSTSIESNRSTKSIPDTTSSHIKSLLITFSISATYTLTSYFIPILKNIPIFGNYIAHTYQWTFQPSPAYIGQGIIMGLPTVSYMLFGSILGWGILAPLAKYMKWAPGEINDWINGGQGWILWISLSVMISDSLVSFIIVSIKSLHRAYTHINPITYYPLLPADSDSNNDPSSSTYEFKNNPNVIPSVPKHHLVSTRTAIIGITASTILCIICLYLVFGNTIPVYASFMAIILAMLFSILGVRALGETDLNPVSGIGKLSQLLFALIIPKSHPARVLINLVAGGVAEAGAQQAGDLMQDLKTGHLIGASPKAQFTAQIIGTIYSVFLSSIIYKLYNSIYSIPNETFRIPTAIIWIDCSRLVTGQGLPPYAYEFSLVFGVIFGIISLLKNTIPSTSKYHKYLVYLPSGVAVGIGIYNTPNFTLARFIGGVVSFMWSRQGMDRIGMIILSSGLVLGEGLLSVVIMGLASMGV
ncbi:putative oligopeptide transporter [Spathaspora sp. JA1]|nr:putative oligopeptide transporter [Spathaspora sp. JA1]